MKLWFNRYIKFIVLILFVLMNSLIIFESALPGTLSSQRSNFFTDVAKFIVNGMTPEKEPEFVNVTHIEIKDHHGIVIEDEQRLEIPLSITRKFTASVFPLDATNPNVLWSSSNSDILRVTSGGYLEARSLGKDVEVIVKSADNPSILKRLYVDVINKKAPSNFFVSLDTSDLMVGYSRRLTIDVGTQNSSEFDMTLLDYHSSNEAVAKINEFGVISALSEGTTTISITNHPQTYELKVIKNPNPIIKPTSITLSGPSEGYVYAYIKLLYEFEENVTDKSVTFVSSNEAVARVDNEGNVYGTKVAGTAIIRVYANANFSVYAEKEVTFNEVLPTSITVDSASREVKAGTKITLKTTLHHALGAGYTVTNQEVKFESSDSSIAEVVSNNGNGIVFGKKKGSVTITAISEADPSVNTTIAITVIPLKAINEENIQDFSQFIRKAIGHFTLFFLDGVLGALTFSLFIREKLYRSSLFSLIPGTLIAGLSELIQKFVDGRTASLIDVSIDMLGYLAGVILIFIIYKIVTKKRIKKAITIA